MTNNDILRRLRYIFDFSDSKMLALFARAEQPITRSQLSAWLKKDSDPFSRRCGDTELAVFLNGLINDKRGRREGGRTEPERQLNNNLILRKLKIALNLKSGDILAILARADTRLSQHELSAFFRKPNHKHFRLCQDQILRKFLKGLQLKYRADL